MHDTLGEERPYRILTVVNQWSRSSPVIEAGFRTSGEIVSQILDRVLGDKPGPRSITVDHGTEFQFRARTTRRHPFSLIQIRLVRLIVQIR